MVLKCKDSAIRKNLADVVQRWDLRWDDQTLKGKKIEAHGAPVQLPTPFVFFSERKGDSAELGGKLELFRAFRSSRRNYDPNDEKFHTKPLSKKRGVSCSNFLFYAMKAAVVKTLFPDGLPKEILDKMNEIENLKGISKSDSGEVTKVSKLKQIDFSHFEEFEKLVYEHTKNNKDISEEMKLELVRFLLSPVKGRGIIDFCNNIMNFSNVCEFSGYLIYEKDTKGKMTPLVMDSDSYSEFSQPGITHKMEVTTEELVNAEIEIPHFDSPGVSFKGK
jgi:hypothetical protein